MSPFVSKVEFEGSVTEKNLSAFVVGLAIGLMAGIPVGLVSVFAAHILGIL